MRKLLTAITLAVAIALPAAAQTGSSREVKWTIGAGVGVAPDFEGSEDYGPVPLINLRAAMGDFYVQLRPSTVRALQLRANLVPGGMFQAGPLLNFRPERGDVDNNRVDNMQDVDAAFEIGAFVAYILSLGDDPRAALELNFEFAADVSDEHEGWLFQPGVDLSMPLSQSFVFLSRVFTTYATEDYMDTYFGVDAADSARSGVSQFDADAGLKDIGIQIGLGYDLTKSWRFGVNASWTRLLDDAEDSPIVDKEGNENQFFAGLQVNFRF